MYYATCVYALTSGHLLTINTLCRMALTGTIVHCVFLVFLCNTFSSANNHVRKRLLFVPLNNSSRIIVGQHLSYGDRCMRVPLSSVWQCLKLVAGDKSFLIYWSKYLTRVRHAANEIWMKVCINCWLIFVSRAVKTLFGFDILCSELIVERKRIGKYTGALFLCRMQ